MGLRNMFLKKLKALSIKDLLIDFLNINFLYRKIILITMDIVLILFSFFIVDYLINKNIFFKQQNLIFIIFSIIFYSLAGQYRSITRFLIALWVKG